MNSKRSRSLYREALHTLVLSGAVLFVLGLLASQSFAHQQIVQLLLVAGSLAGGLLLALHMARFRTRLCAAETLEQQLRSVGNEDSAATVQQLYPLAHRSLVSQGWNRMVRLVQDRSLDQSIERRLQSKQSGRKTERFARAIRSMPDGIATSDAQGGLSYANPAWLNLMNLDGESEPQLSGTTIADCLNHWGVSNWSDVQPQLLKGTRPRTFVLHQGTATHHGVLQLSRLPLEGRVDEAEGFLWTLKDITQQSLANEAHEQFLSSATHELRTPLTNIRAYTESLLEIENISPDQQREFFNIINSEAGRMGRLLNQLLDIQQLEAGSMTVRIAAFDVLRMMQEIQEHITPLLREKQLKLNCRIAPSLKTIHADKEKVTSCLVNLLGNAIKYTPAGGEIRLMAEQMETHLAIAVEDTGIGIAEEELPKIFERFYRCQDERVNDVEGNGLGLAFCMEVARLHGGELAVDSQLNKGSRFTLSLPLAKKS